MPNPYFQFKQFTIRQDNSAMKVGTDGVLLGAWAKVANTKTVLDIGTGTGLIAIMIAQRSTASVIAIEPQKKMYIQAGDNIRNCPWADRIRVYNESLQQFVKTGGKREYREYDLIVTNPPFFINSKKAPQEDRMLARHAVTLDYSDILRGVDRLLDHEGRFCLILPYVEANIFIAEAVSYGLYCNRKLNIQPVSGKKISRILMEFNRKKKSPAEQTIIIESGGRHKYSKAYIKLTKDFYL